MYMDTKQTQRMDCNVAQVTPVVTGGITEPAYTNVSFQDATRTLITSTEEWLLRTPTEQTHAVYEVT